MFGEINSTYYKGNYMHSQFLRTMQSTYRQLLSPSSEEKIGSQRFRILPKVTHIVRRGVTLLFIQEIQLLLQKKLTAQINMDLYLKQLLHLTDIKI